MTPRLTYALGAAQEYARDNRKEYVTPEILLHCILAYDEGSALLESYQCPLYYMLEHLGKLMDMVECVPEDIEYKLQYSQQMLEVWQKSQQIAHDAGQDQFDIPHVLQAILSLQESMARYALILYTTSDLAELLTTVIAIYNGEKVPLHVRQQATADEEDGNYDLDDYDECQESSRRTTSQSDTGWRNLVTCINDHLAEHNPLIGREAELDRTIQVLCRCDKNNPLHIGEAGVGKTALVYGLAARIEAGQVPERLLGARIYQMDMSTMVAGTSYRGDFEKRIKAIMDGILSEGNAIVYIDEIHTLIGAGATDGSALDGSNMLKPYLEGGQIRFIGSTTYQEFNRHIQKSHGFVRRFQQIDIAEPSQAETIAILHGLQHRYESFHGVTFEPGVIEYAVEASARHINGRFLPDKAIDLIDEAGAWRQLHPLTRRYKGVIRPSKRQTVGRDLINDVLARVCKIDPRSLKDEDTQQLETLDQRIRSQIYGQDHAIRQVVEAVQMGKAGLLDDDKPIASLLFVGPTGVGKTEVCKVLAKELGIELIRFDMSEYTEKHTVAKLIGSPAGYVGYEDGGLLTDAIRRTPHCVLLLDEIEKAHSDIYNILLQIMDYARLTDNKGQRADFRHVILIMTSNAGAQFAHQASVGFGSQVSAGNAMLNAVRKTFKPEFIARLSASVVFNDMDQTMASMILDKKLRILSSRLEARNVTMQLSLEAHRWLLQRGFTQRMGAREMDHQISQHLSPLLMREILFGRLRHGGLAVVDLQGEALTLSVR